MKRALFLLLAITLTLVAACQPDENQNKNKNAIANANANTNANGNQGIAPSLGPNDKRVEIFVHDVKGNPGYYTIEDPSPVTLSTVLKQKVYWCVSYDGTTPPDEVELNEFHTTAVGPLVTNPFGNGSASDNDFDVPAVQINNCVATLHAPKTSVTLGEYKYTITAKVGGVDRGHVDPRVIINQ